MIARAATAAFIFIAAAACGRDAAAPTAPTRAQEPTVQFKVTVDSLGSAVAIPSVSKVLNGEILIGDPSWNRTMRLTLKGGSADGKTLDFGYSEPF